MPVVAVNQVWKTYHGQSVIGIKERLVGKRVESQDQRFARGWALQDITFKVDAGRSLGIIGHNGTGKSTLLSLVLGTIKEDKGVISRTGRIGAMLELGSGFHPDLTGRENVFLNGSILGLRIGEIKRRFDSIVAFSELGSAIDLPTRAYSAGMSARLSFAILAHAERDILLIDEILAVGDAAFQAKCAAYLANYTASGGTLIAASHDLKSLQTLCIEAIWLHEGRLVEQGPIAAVTRSYEESIATRGV